MGESQGKPSGVLGRFFGKGASPKEAKDAQVARDGVSGSDGDGTGQAGDGAGNQSDLREPDTDQGAEAVDKTSAKTSWFSRLKSGLSKTSGQLTSGITGLFTKAKLDPETLEDFEDLLIQADLGVATAMRITDALSKSRVDKGLTPDAVREVLVQEVERVLQPVAQPLKIDPTNRPHVLLMVGVNGTGKTTTIGKLASTYQQLGLKVMLAAGDTFRAAAI
ncbi:MAG: signal recognition particle receptor subunit alpha, partial [Pseudomonadota bacterium]